MINYNIHYYLDLFIYSKVRGNERVVGRQRKGKR